MPCDLCNAETSLAQFDVPAAAGTEPLNICGTCMDAVNAPSDHWHCLPETMWSENQGVQIMAYRLLKRQSSETWAQDALDMLYLEPDMLEAAEAGLFKAAVVTHDSNGTVLETGDTVTLIKDLPVKGAGFTAKRGTSVRGISLTDNPEHVEGRVNGQRIVLVSAFLKKNT